LAATAIDLVRDRRDAVVAELLKYADTDLLCYRATRPAELVARQEQLWQPFWTGRCSASTPPDRHLGSRSDRAARKRRRRPPQSALGIFRPGIDGTSPRHRDGGLARDRARADRAPARPESAFAAAEIDESFQISRWGEDPEQATRSAALKADLALAARFAALARNAPGALALPSA